MKPHEFMSELAGRFTLKEDSMKEPIQGLDADVGKFHLGGDCNTLYLFADMYMIKLVKVGQKLVCQGNDTHLIRPLSLMYQGAILSESMWIFEMVC